MELISKSDISEALKLKKLGLEPLGFPIMNLLNINKINNLHKSYHHLSVDKYINSVLKKLDIRIDIDPNDLNNIPEKGAFICIANHPYGGIDGLMLMHLILKKRPDFKVMGNFMLQKIEPLNNHIIPVNPFDKKITDKSSIVGIKQLFETISAGQGVGIFPAGEVSSFQRQDRLISDNEWKEIVGRIIQKANVPVLPIYFSGNNSLFFSLIGMIHPNLRTLRLPTEMLNKKGNVIKVHIGKAVSTKTINQFSQTDTLMHYLRARTYSLHNGVEVKPFFENVFKLQTRKHESILPSVSKHLIRKEINALKQSDAFLFSHLNYDVFVARHSSIPNVMNEIGRLREITFREAGEGTGKNCDIDAFDLHYHHLFLWDNEREKIVGAYRMGLGSDIYRKFRLKGFYINTLFKIKSGFKPVLMNSIELGRSFIVKEYQNKHFPLLLLWKGIHEFASRHPQHQYLLGPVSISNEYSSFSKSMMINYLQKYYWENDLASFVEARIRFNTKIKNINVDHLIPNDVMSFKDLEEILSSVEKKNCKMPVLLKKYLKQDAKIICFNQDPDFSNVIDGLILLNLKNLNSNTQELIT